MPTFAARLQRFAGGLFLCGTVPPPRGGPNGPYLAAGGDELKRKMDMIEGRSKVGISRFFACLICVLLAFAPICSAYADSYEGGGGGSHNVGGSYPNFGTVWYGPKSSNVDGNLVSRYGVVAYTLYDAAFYCCVGSDVLVFNELSGTKKSKLLANSDFMALANTFSVGKPATTSDWGTDAEIVLAWNSARFMYGETYCYSSMYTSTQLSKATTAIRNILAEDDTPSGGGGGGESAGDAFTYAGTTYVPLLQWDNSWSYDGLSTIGVSSSNYNVVSEYAAAEGYKMYAFMTNGGAGTNARPANQPDYVTAWVIAIDPDNVTFDSDSHSISFDEAFDTKCIRTDNLKSRISSRVNTATVPGHGTFKYIPVTDSARDETFRSGVFSYKASGTTDGLQNMFELVPIYLTSEIGGNSEVEDPDPDPDPDPPVWPTPPSKPVGGSPDVPTPGDPIDPTPPDPIDPTPPDPWSPIPDIDIDITGEDFQDLIDALDEHCKHLQASIQSNVSQLWDLQSAFLGSAFSDLYDTLNDNFDWLGNDVIVASFTDLKSYLKELFDWLSERMDFNIQVEGGEYDDTSVIYWLKQIWSKLGNGINTRPVDPNIDTNGWWDWFSGLLAGLVGSLADIGMDKIGGLVDALDTLREKFPFCVPWDIAALLGLLVSEPVTPVVRVPLMALSVSEGVQQVGTMVIDLSTYNAPWEAVRWIERIAFCVYLATRTKDFLDLLGKIKG